jgi:hypothetical protein
MLANLASMACAMQHGYGAVSDVELSACQPVKRCQSQLSELVQACTREQISGLFDGWQRGYI